MNAGMLLMIGGLLACASLGVRWGVQQDGSIVGQQNQDFWPWAAYCLSIVGLTCSVLMILTCAIMRFFPEQAEVFSGPIVALSTGFLVGFFIDQRNARKKKH